MEMHLSALAFCMVALLTGGLPARAADTPVLAIVSFDFRDTSGEPKDQSADHGRRLQALNDVLLEEFPGAPETIKPVAVRCGKGPARSPPIPWSG